MRAMLLLGAGLTAMLALSGCQKKTDAAKTGEAPQVSAAASAGSATPPTRKPGLWSQTVDTAGVHQVSKICLDPATDARMTAWGQAMGEGKCSQQAFTPVPGGWRFESACDLGGAGKVATRGTVTGDLNSKYVVKATSVTSGSSMPKANGSHEMEVTATWEGPCPANMRPGDMAMTVPGMAKPVTMNIMDMAAKK